MVDPLPKKSRALHLAVLVEPLDMNRVTLRMWVHHAIQISRQ